MDTRDPANAHGLPWQRAALGLCAALACGSVPFAVTVSAWPEVVTPAYFISRGLVMYRDIWFPHTPILTHLTAVAGLLFGFSAPTFRAIVAVSCAATGALVGLGTRRRPTVRDAALGLILGAPLVTLWTVYTEGPALWPDHWMAPLLVAAALSLERFERGGDTVGLVGGGLLLGTAILVKQTSAWVSLAAIVWLVLASRRRSWARLFWLAAAVCAPFLVFVLGWFLATGGWSHVRWTLLVPLHMGSAGDNLHPLSDAHEMVVLGLAIPALALARRSLPAARRLSPAAPWLLLGCVGMTLPRGGLLHVASSVGLVALLSVRSALALGVFVRRWLRGRPATARLIAFAAGAACLTVSLAVAALGAGPLAVDRLGGPTHFWDDATVRRTAAMVRAHVGPGGELLVYHVPHQTLYPLTETVFPGGVYINPDFWDCLNKEGSDQRLVSVLAGRPGLPVLFREPPMDEPEHRATQTYRFLTTHTEVVEDGRDAVWLRVQGVEQ